MEDLILTNCHPDSIASMRTDLILQLKPTNWVQFEKYLTRICKNQSINQRVFKIWHCKFSMNIFDNQDMKGLLRNRHNEASGVNTKTCTRSHLHKYILLLARIQKVRINITSADGVTSWNHYVYGWTHWFIGSLRWRFGYYIYSLKLIFLLKPINSIYSQNLF